MDDYKGNFYKLAAWKKVRNEVRAERKGLCEECLKHGIYRAADVVHHIKPITPANITDPTITLNKDNLMLLCHDCHNKTHSRVERVRFDANGNILPPLSE